MLSSKDIVLSTGISKRRSPLHREQPANNTSTSTDPILLYPPGASFPSQNGKSGVSSAALKRKQRGNRNRIDAVTYNHSTRTLVVVLAGLAVLGIVILVISYSARNMARYDGDPFYLRSNNHEFMYPRTLYFLGHSQRVSTWDYVFTEVVQSSSHFFSMSVLPMISRDDQQGRDDSREYIDRQPDEFETKNCKAMFPWQLEMFPTCNSIHEIDMLQASASSHSMTGGKLVFLTSGFWRDVWVLHNSTWQDDKVVLKTIRYMHNVTQRNFDRNRRDALVMERLTKSPWVLDVYGFCANTGFYEYADGGDISAAIWTKVKKQSSRSPQHQQAQQDNDTLRRVNHNLTSQQKMEIGEQQCTPKAVSQSNTCSNNS